MAGRPRHICEDLYKDTLLIHHVGFEGLYDQDGMRGIGGWNHLERDPQRHCPHQGGRSHMLKSDAKGVGIRIMRSYRFLCAADNFIRICRVKAKMIIEQHHLFVEVLDRGAIQSRRVPYFLEGSPAKRKTIPATLPSAHRKEVPTLAPTGYCLCPIRPVPNPGQGSGPRCPT
jgi:hypothetical protein